MKKIPTILKWILLFLGFLPGANVTYAQTQDPVVVMAYNLLNYPDANSFASDTSLRNPEFRTIVSAVNPDIMVVEEINSQSGYLGFLSNVMNANGIQYGAAPYVNSYDTDRGLFYRTSKFQCIGNTPILTDLRDINEFKLVHIATGDTLRVYAVHLKASSGSTFELQRASEIDSLRKITNSLPAGANFIVCGDFNFYSSGEPAYQKLLQVQSGNQGHFYDAITMTGTWNNPAYAQYHTQSPRIRSFGGGITGGLDDRFDLILYSKGINDPGGVTYAAGSLHTFGNDGNHYNDSINRPPNTAVSVAVANALHNAADHLPVVMTLNFSVSSGTPPDAGVSAFIQPSSSCPASGVTLKVKVKNYSTSTLNLANDNVTVHLKVISPGGVISDFSRVLNSGYISAGLDSIVNLQPAYDMLSGGTYTFSAYTTLSTNDANAENDSMPVSNFSIVTGLTPTLSPQGAIQICSGNTITISASGGASYQWSNGMVTPSVVVSTAGSYSVTVTGLSGCSATLGPVLVTVASQQSNDTLFYEDIGSVTATTTIAAHELNNGFLRDDFTMSGSADIRNTLNSVGYGMASGGANVFITNIVNRNFIISGINTIGKNNLRLSFGIYKSTIASTGADFKVQYSTDGVNYTDISYPSLTGGAGWSFRIATGTIPATANLRLRFMNTGTITQYRIDDILLTATASPSISNSGNNFVCPGGSVVLTASPGNAWLWSNGATTQSITVTDPGSYSVNVDCIAAAPYIVQSCPSPVLQLHLFLEALYMGAGVMRAGLYDIGQSTDPTACDTIHVELRADIPPYDLEFETNVVLSVTGNALLQLPVSLINQNYYVVVKHRNSLETWSKMPVLISSGAIVNYNFSSP